jgi:hypothetical protein
MTDKERMSLLPEGFETLERFVPRWTAMTTQERWDERSSASMPDIEQFYGDMLLHADRALAYLDGQPLLNLSKEASHLMRLMLSLANCAMAVELHKGPRAPYSPFPHGVTVVRGGYPYG